MSTNTQPSWKLLANLGDVNPVEYGGYFVYVDETAVYASEGEILCEPSDDVDPDTATARWTVYRFSLDQCKVVDGVLVSVDYQPDWPHPLPQYAKWFAKDLDKVASCCGWSLDEAILMLCSTDPLERAHIYRDIGEYHGMANLDSHPFTLTRAEVEARYAQDTHTLAP
jgi:hypothetical protein